jgi:glycosyltransferase involved in cell wall biosynthesis
MSYESSSVDPRHPKVWIVAPSAPPYGGMSVQAEKLYTKLAGEGIRVEFIATNPPAPHALNILGRVPGVRTALREIQYLFSLRRLLREPGVIHHFSASYLYFFLHSSPLLLLGQLLPLKLVLNYRGGKAADFLRSWSGAVVPLMKTADQVVVPSEFLQRIFQNFGLNSALLPNLADTELFPFVERSPLTPRLFMSRNLEAMYDVECGLRAFRIVQDRIPEATLGIAGDGTEARRLRSLAAEWGLRGVTFYGAVPHCELPARYALHDIYVNASRVDNFPAGLVEAACAGLPIVTTKAGGIPEMIRHRENGLLVEIGDHAALADGILELLRHQEFAHQLTRAARGWAEQFSWSAVFPKLLRCYGLAEPQDVDVKPVHSLVH